MTNVFTAFGHLLHHSLSRDRNCFDGPAMGPAWLAGIERLGKQLFSAARRAQSRLWRAKVRGLGMGARRSIRDRNFESRNGPLGVNQFPPDCEGTGLWTAFYGKLGP